jgi:uncharacterized phage-associated protein
MGVFHERTPEAPLGSRLTTVRAQEVAAELRKRLPGVAVKKLHKLLYYCQGHHLATFNSPLFSESISAWDVGPVVGSLWKHEKDHGAEGRTVESGGSMDEGALNTVGYVVSRYGALTGSDLERLTHSEDPWLDADAERDMGGSVRIPVSALATFFRANAADEEDQSPEPDLAEVRAWLRGATDDQTPVTRDTFDGIRARARSHG